jgi:hypothetical protein
VGIRKWEGKTSAEFSLEYVGFSVPGGSQEGHRPQRQVGGHQHRGGA